MAQILTANSFDLSKVKFSKVRPLNKGKMVFVNYNNGKVILKTPKMYIPFGMKCWDDEGKAKMEELKYELSLSFNGYDTNPKIKEFFDKVKEYDEFIKNAIVKNSKEWLGFEVKSKKDVETRECYNESIKQCKKNGVVSTEYAPTMRLKVDREKTEEGFTGNFIASNSTQSPLIFVDSNLKELTCNEKNYASVVPNGCHMSAVIELSYVSLVNKTVSTKWKLVQAKVFKKQTGLSGLCFTAGEDSDCEEEEENNENELQEDLDSIEEPKEEPKDSESEVEVEVESESESDSESEVEVEVESDSESEVEVEVEELKEEPEPPKIKSPPVKAKRTNKK